jgi:hypothetical protein
MSLPPPPKRCRQVTSSCPEPFVSATAAAAAWRWALDVCPELVSEINVAQPPVSDGCETVTPWDTCSATPASPPPTSSRTSKVDALERVGCYRVFTETTSGTRNDRPTLAQVLDQLRPGDTLVVWKLDRLGRSLRR